nr:type VII secretion-associated protein [Pseudonocardia acidicola]
MDAAELGPVRVPARPEAEALLGALREPAPAVAAAGAGGGWITAQARPGAPGVPVGLEPGRGARATGRRAAAERAPGRAAAEPACGRAAAEPAFRWLPPVPPRPRRPLRIAVAAAAGVAVAGALLAGVLPGPPTAASGDAPPAGVLVQYGYRIDLPAGWEHTGGLPERRRTLITPVTAPDGSDLISVERSDLGYDANAEPDRALRELRAEFDAAVAGGAPLTGFDSAARVAGRPGAGYQQVMGGGAVVDWFVVLDRGAQLSVGCQHTAAGAAAVERACAAVVGSLRLQ